MEGGVLSFVVGISQVTGNFYKLWSAGLLGIAYLNLHLQ
jgi:hypothetical protein